jgi:hypothetical protein
MMRTQGKPCCRYQYHVSLVALVIYLWLPSSLHMTDAFTITSTRTRITAQSPSLFSNYNHRILTTSKKFQCQRSPYSSTKYRHSFLQQSSSSSESLSESNESPNSRPDWALPWMPTWLITLSPRYQFCLVILFYIFHLKVLCQKSLAFPYQLIPNHQGHFQSIGFDSLAGMASFLGFCRCCRRHNVVVFHGDFQSLPFKLPK